MNVEMCIMTLVLHQSIDIYKPMSHGCLFSLQSNSNATPSIKMLDEFDEALTLKMMMTMMPIVTEG